MKALTIKKIMTYLGTSLLYSMASLLVVTVVFGCMFWDYLPMVSLAIGDKKTEFGTQDVKDLDIKDLSSITGGVLEGSKVHFPVYGEQLGSIVITGKNGESVNTKLYYGDGDAQLASGVGVFMGSTPPGYGSTALVAGHNHTWFKPLREVEVGDTVSLTTYYGAYTYRVREIAIKPATSPKTHEEMNFAADYDNLILYTCYPFGSIGMTRDRYFVFCEYLSGPMVDRSK